MTDRRAAHRQFLVFLIGGGLSALIDVGLMQGLILANVNYLIAASVGFLLGLLFNYFFHAALTFRAKPTTRSLRRYLILVVANYAFTLACVGVAVHWGGQAVIGKLISLPLVAINGFVIGKYWIFKPAD